MLLDISKNKAFWLSGFIHLALILLIGLSTTHIPTQAPTTNQPIKSYLYQKPNVRPEPIIVTQPFIGEEEPEEQLPSEVEPRVEATDAIKEKTLKPSEPDVIKQDQINQLARPRDIITPQAPKKTLSALEHLEQLKKSVNTAPKYQPNYNYGSNQPSIFNQNLPTVPRYTKPIDPDEEKEANTQKLTGDLSITKHDNGTCTITEDLTSITMEGIVATQSFNCGESKFDKSFREHMAKYKNGRSID